MRMCHSIPQAVAPGARLAGLTGTRQAQRLRAHAPDTVAVCVETIDPVRRYAVERLFEMIGLRPHFVDDDAVDVYYGPRADEFRPGVLRIPTHPSLDDTAHSPDIIERNGLVFPSFGPHPTAAWIGDRLRFDLFRAAAWWLRLETERLTTSRDAHGRVAPPDLPGSIDLWTARPPLHAYADLLLSRLRERRRDLHPWPRWPAGKLFAVVLTHDVDDPERSAAAGLGHELRALRRAFRAGPRTAYWQARAARPGERLQALLTPPTHRAEWDFAEYRRAEQATPLPAAYYFAVANRRSDHPLDVAYRVSRRRYRRLFRALADNGCEVGLHAGYEAADRPGAIERECARLGELANARILGIRHHFLRLDPHRPLETLAAHAAAGLAYDSSVSFNNHAGFRAGIALPYTVFGAAGPDGDSLIELPLTLSDQHLPPHDPSAAVARAMEHLDCVRSLGGLAVLNWHVGHWWSRPGWRAAYGAVCERLAREPSVWVATPTAIAGWWRERGRALLAD